MTRLTSIVVLLCMLIGISVFADEALIKPQTQGNVQFVTGGVGEAEHKAMRAIRGNYNFHLVLAVKGTGEYVSNVNVKITGSKGKTELDTVTSGPDLFAKLPPGRYDLSADRDGHIVNETVVIPRTHGIFLDLYFPSEKGD